MRFVTVRQLASEAAQSLDQIKDQAARLRTLRIVCDKVLRLSREDQQPFIDRILRESQQNGGPDLIIRHDRSYGLIAPELMVAIAGGAAENRHRDDCLAYIVSTVAERNADLARRALAKIEGAEVKSQALYDFSRLGAKDFAEAKACLEQARDLGALPGGYRWPNAYAVTLARFAESDHESVTEFLQSAFDPADSIEALCTLVHYCRLRQFDAKIAQRLIDLAVKRFPESTNPKRSAEALLGAGYSNQSIADAFALFDKHLRPKLSPGYVDRKYFLLIPSDTLDVEGVTARIAERYDLPRQELFAKAWGHIAHAEGPQRPLQWLRAAQHTSLRDVAIGPIAVGLAGYASGHRVGPPMVCEWIDVLAGPALAAQDPEQCFFACLDVHHLARGYACGAPAEIEERLKELSPRFFRNVDPSDRASWIHWYPRHLQAFEIGRVWFGLWNGSDDFKNDPRGAAALVRDSTLPLRQKLTWYEVFLRDARAEPDEQRRALILSGLGLGLAAIDPDFSLKVHAEELVLAKKLGLRTEMRDYLDDLGPVFALANVAEVLNWSFRMPHRNDTEVVKALWKFAALQQDVDDRDAVYEMLVKVLLRSQRLQQAAGVAPLINAQAERSQALAAIAAAMRDLEIVEERKRR